MFFRAAEIRPDSRRSRSAQALWLGPALLLLALQGCERGADTGATSNPVAPGRPGNNTTAREVAPRPGSINESPQVGGSTAQVPAGVTGSGGTTDVPGQLQGNSTIPRQPGVGLDGGMDGATARSREGALGAGPLGTGPASGTDNATSGNAVGQR